MPNQLNYPAPIETTEFQRPIRITESDAELLGFQKQQILFGTTVRDVVELWIYNPDGTFAGHMNLNYADPAVTVASIIGQNGATEVLNVDMRDVGNRMEIQPGRYAMVLNFLRNEVGSEEGYKLFISEISPSRTELKLIPITFNIQTRQDIFEFLVPSVPRVYAKAILDASFGKAIESPVSAQLDSQKVAVELNNLEDNTYDRIVQGGMLTIYNNMIAKIKTEAYPLALAALVADATNAQVQAVELEAYVEKAFETVIYGMKQRGEFDPRFSVI